MTRPRVLYVGSREPPEFAGAVEWLGNHVALVRAADLAAARYLAAADDVPFELIVVEQDRPGEHSHESLAALRDIAPLTPIVCLLGSFCEGEARTGKPWPGAVRVYAHQFVARVGAQLERRAREGSAAWTPPFTATDEDRLLGFLFPSSTAAGLASSLTACVAVIANDREAACALCDALVRGGSAAFWRRDGLDAGDEPDVVVWDCAAGFVSVQASFDRLVRQAPQTPKIVLAGFPRAEDRARALERGAMAVISKPFLMEDLLWQLRECLVSGRG